MTVITVAACTLNQWALDFKGNYERILESILEAKRQGAVFRLGPELELSGYGCNDHFHEPDTFLHCYQMLAKLLKHEGTRDIVCDVGMPIMHKSVRYNCRVTFYNGKILLIRPKKIMANDGNYRELRWFTPWMKDKVVEEYKLPAVLREATKQTAVPFGDGIISSVDVCIGSEICEELWSPASTHVSMGLDGVHIFANGSGSHHELRKFRSRLDLILNATRKIGGIYMYANMRGNDGERVYYDGGSVIIINGKLVAQADQFSLNDVEVITATIDIDEVRTYRGAISSLGMKSSMSEDYPRVHFDAELCDTSLIHRPISGEIPATIHTPEEEISLGPALWMWDYLRRSGLGGFFLPLSGGLDSSSTATIVFSMCRLVFQAAVEDHSERVLADLRRVTRDDTFTPSSPQEIAGKIFFTMYMGSANSSEATRARAKSLSANIGANYNAINIDTIVAAFESVFTLLTGKTLKYKTHGGENWENLALQNIQARVRMVLAYLFGLTLPWLHGCKSGLLVLGSANVDECLRGYYTKYDCSAADINPIGGLSKIDLKAFVRYATTEFSLPALSDVVDAPPTAELEPITEAYTQTDEEDMGMTYEELSIYGRLRKVEKCGPLSMFKKLATRWSDKFTACEIAGKVKYFFKMYSINRHKTTILTPSYHAEAYSPDDNRYDQRPFLYNTRWELPFECIDEHVAAIKAVAAIKDAEQQIIEGSTSKGQEKVDEGST